MSNRRVVNTVGRSFIAANLLIPSSYEGMDNGRARVMTAISPMIITIRIYLHAFPGGSGENTSIKGLTLKTPNRDYTCGLGHG
jgi:hypothetical protein